MKSKIYRYRGIRVTKQESIQLRKLNSKIVKLKSMDIHAKGIKHAEKIGRDLYKAFSKKDQIERKIYQRRMKK